MSVELEALRQARLQSKPLSMQLRMAEKQVRGQRKAVEAAKVFAVEAQEAAKLAEIAVTEAMQQIAACEKVLREAEE